tara:strand:- start:382 stop:519 length:138 start_codon:yes stop_codon:yes gene_type:complete
MKTPERSIEEILLKYGPELNKKSVSLRVILKEFEAKIRKEYDPNR